MSPLLAPKWTFGLPHEKSAFWGERTPCFNEYTPWTMIPAGGIRFCEIMRKQDQILSMFDCSITLRHFAISALM